MSDELKQGNSVDLIHLCNNYTSSVVHKLIGDHMRKQFQKQAFIIPVRSYDELSVADDSDSKVCLAPVFYRNRILRFFPLVKVGWVFSRVFRALNEFFDDKKTRAIIAHNFWSDGMVAFFYSFFRRISFTLVVRNTDINVFIPGLPHYRWLMKWMVRRSHALVFVSEAHRRTFSLRFPKLYESAARIAVIPNGLESFWLDNESTQAVRKARVCYVGKFNRNKNLVRLVNACELILDDYPQLELVLVGGEVDELEEMLAKPVPEFVEVLGTIRNKEELKEVYQSSRVFAMPSVTETFGLVYLEALSQGCAVVCTRHQGIDGMFDFPFVQAVDPLDTNSISASLRNLLQFENGVASAQVRCTLSQFSWEYVGKRYAEVVQ
ncbi:glycosyltransferase family 4 protein [Marinobacter shengliensis]|uniref:glycosyltransferase family 4 protein n=1 Tax=Marinobacter shengliensis TaxID=1389223 RepID=UPI0025736B2E|nr:glycosyltransferase family 4 protein [Marinobacter shengliensis]BEH15195.1 hypothetical protein MAALD49_25630 [Marinobacter shengliensis]